MNPSLAISLEYPPIARIRRNHGLEHATLHVLAERQHQRWLAGHSNPGGFWIIGEVSTEELNSAAQEALQRLRSGEIALAVHPNCGTNLAVSGLMAGAVAALAMFGAGRRLRDKFDRMPLAITLATLALVAAKPLGLAVQQNITTSGDPGDLEIIDIIPRKFRNLPAHQVITRS